MIVAHKVPPALPKVRDGAGHVAGDGCTSFSGGFFAMESP
jgi:hypothetical protein